MPEPTDEQIADYVKSLPKYYQRILAAFPECEPDRRPMEMLSFSTLFLQLFPNEQNARVISDFENALRKLAGNRILIFENDDTDGSIVAVSPTDLGERMIAALTGNDARQRAIPELPAMPWQKTVGF